MILLKLLIKTEKYKVIELYKKFKDNNSINNFILKNDELRGIFFKKYQLSIFKNYLLIIIIEKR